MKVVLHAPSLQLPPATSSYLQLPPAPASLLPRSNPEVPEVDGHPAAPDAWPNSGSLDRGGASETRSDFPADPGRSFYEGAQGMNGPKAHVFINQDFGP